MHKKRYNITSQEKRGRAEAKTEGVDFDAIKGMFDLYDVDGDGTIDAEEFMEMVIKLGVAPKLKDAKKVEL